MSVKTLDDVLYHALKDLLSAEKQFRDALPKLADAAADTELAQAFRDHHDETLVQIKRLEQCFKLVDRAERSEKCEAAAGITDEGKEMIEEKGEQPAKDLMLIAAGRKTEHYEIVSYSDAGHWSEMLGHADVSTLLYQTLEEERSADQKLHSIGKRLAKECLATV